MTRHIVEAFGKARLIIEDGEIKVIRPPIIKRCPLLEKLELVDGPLTAESVKEAARRVMERYGVYTASRPIASEEDIVAFGASETLFSAIKQGLLEAAVIVCDGAGTLVASSPEAVQGVGGIMSCLIETSPISEVIEALQRQGCRVLDAETARIDQVEGVKLASEMGFKRIGVTVTSGFEASRIRELSERLKLIVAIFAIHTTGVSREEALLLGEHCDVVTGCASKWVRELVGAKALLQVGTTIPVFALTTLGKELLLARLKDLNRPLLVGFSKLPKMGDRSPEPLV